MRIFRVKYDCEFCDAPCETTNHNLRYRKHYKNKHYCQKCIIRLCKASRVFDRIPVKYYKSALLDELDFDVAKKYLQEVRTNVKVLYLCDKCDKNVRIRWCKILDRKHEKFSKLCNICLQRRISNDEDMKRQNVEHSRGLWADKGFREKALASFMEHNRKMRFDVEYSQRYRRKSRSVVGVIIIDRREIEFDSGYELIFIHEIIDKCSVFRRCLTPIKYEHGYYHPDFFIIRDGISEIVEVKGYYNNNVGKKAEAAERFIIETGIADKYSFYNTTRLIEEGILSGVGGARMWKQIKKVNNARIIKFAEEKHKKSAEIGRSWRG